MSRKQPSLQWTNRAYRAALHCLRGDTAEATRLGQESLAHAGGVGDFDARLINSGILGAAAWQHGTLADDVDRLMADAEEFAPGYGQGWHSPFR